MYAGKPLITCHFLIIHLLRHINVQKRLATVLNHQRYLKAQMTETKNELLFTLDRHDDRHF